MHSWTCCCWRGGLWALSSAASSPWGSTGSGPRPGDTVYRQGEPAESLYILISGRLRLLRADPDGEGPMVVEEEV